MKTKRFEKNPIITPADIIPSNNHMKVIGVFNCGVEIYGDEIILLMRVAENVISDNDFIGVPIYDNTIGEMTIINFDKKNLDIDFSDVRFVKTKEQLYLTSISHLRIARSKDGINFRIDEKPFMLASTEYEMFGIEDPRITKIDDKFYINYSAISPSGVTTCLAVTKDFETVEKLGIIFLADNKDVTIFPEKINGKYYALNRPVSAYFQKPEIWISESDNLLAYSNHKMILSLRENNFDSSRIGASCVPFLTEFGWIEIYHGADKNNQYCLGAVLLDKNDPSIVISRTKNPIVKPEEWYEKTGFMPNVIFACGHLIKDDTIHLYYGNCDENICYLTFLLSDLLKELGV